VQEHYGTVTSFLVTEQSRTYYQAKGVLKQVEADEPRDAWYFRVRDMQAPYEINVDVDMANDDRMTVFINYKVFDYQQRFIGATGVGLTVDAVVKLIDTYQQRYSRSVFFVDTDGRIVLTGASGGPMGARVGQSLSELPELANLMAQLPLPGSGNFEYRQQGRGHFLNVRFIPELNWYRPARGGRAGRLGSGLRRRQRACDRHARRSHERGLRGHRAQGRGGSVPGRRRPRRHQPARGPARGRELRSDRG
jgi:hypothetical protein